MKRDNIIRFIINGFIIVCVIFVMLSACTETGEKPTSEPSTDAYVASPIASISPTVVPSEEANVSPSIVPITLQPVAPASPTPEPELTHDYEMLRAFFDSPSKVPGKTNGQLLFKNYNPDNPYTWHVCSEAEHKTYVEYCENDGTADIYYYDEFILWTYGADGNRNYSGYVEEISSFFLGDEETLNFGGTFLLDGFESLSMLELFRLSADGLIITNCDKLTHIYIKGLDSVDRDECFDKVYINEQLFECECTPCAKEFRLIVPYSEARRDFDITAVADGNGLVCVSLEKAADLNNVLVIAKAKSGSHFIGWYDEEGNLVSEREQFMLTEWDQFELFDDIATYIAKFEKD